MIEAYKKFWVNYFSFKGRSTRSDYWYVVLVNFLITILISFASAMVKDLTILTTVYNVITFIPGLTIIVRRFHDINKSGANYFWLFVPVIGWIIILVYLCTASVNENNQYGKIV